MKGRFQEPAPLFIQEMLPPSMKAGGPPMRGMRGVNEGFLATCFDIYT